MAAIQIKNVPEELHEQLRALAAERDESLSDYLLELIRKDLAKPRFQAWIEELERRRPPGYRPPDGPSAGAVIDEINEEREEELYQRGVRARARRAAERGV